MSPDTRHSSLRADALKYHRYPRPGKLEIRPTKPMTTGRDLALAYSPGVAEACIEISKNPMDAAHYTSKRNLVAVVSNGTAVLGLGDIGAQAAKPVMEGKAVLFKKFANLDCFDIEVAESDPEALAEIVIKLEPTFGGVNLEDIKSPDCFLVERICRERMNIPVFHDDQHGTAIVVAAATLNAVHVAKKEISDLQIVALGAGAAGIACLDMLVGLGVRKENILLLDRQGIVSTQRDDLFDEKARYARETDKTNLAEAMVGADFFLGLSGPRLVTKDMIRSMAPNPIVFALANPDPEILPEEVLEAAPNALICTGRSDYPNQVNNVLCFPFLFRGALDVGATAINHEMKVACASAIAKLARDSTSEEVGLAYHGETLNFGPDYLIPRPFDPRLLPHVASAVAAAAMDSGVAARPRDMDEYVQHLLGQVYKSSLIMRPVLEAGRTGSRRVVFAEGEDPRVLYSVQTLITEMRTKPILVGRPDVIRTRIERAGLALQLKRDFDVINPESDRRFAQYWEGYHNLMNRSGVSPFLARTIVRSNTTVIAALMVRFGEADSMICGTIGQYLWHLRYVEQILASDELHPIGALSLILHDAGTLFIGDTHVRADPSAEEIADTVVAAARHVARFGIEPKIALCSDSQFGNLESHSGVVTRKALAILDKQVCDFEFEGEMNTDTALDPELRKTLISNSRLTGKANTLIYSSTVGAGAARNILKSVGAGIEVGPILMGMANRAHIVTPSVTARGLFNIASLALTPVASYG
ncbi:MAG: NADP-dependent malic enzyme [Rhodobacteraceae bacterium]|nr:NADP-dependent malic enzyme [Paracoccaceae bacterium]